MPDIINEKHIFPQHIRTYFQDATPFPPSGSSTPAARNPGRAAPPPTATPGTNTLATATAITNTNVLTIYTGLVHDISFVRDGDPGVWDYQMPVLGLFTGGTKGFFPMQRGELLGATAMVALAELQDTTDPARWAIANAQADMLSVTLASGTPGGSPPRSLLWYFLSDSMG
jgi:hypothetical protein